MNEMYYPFTESCSDHFECTESGWMILQLAVLATVGHIDEAAKRVAELPDESFNNAGGNGHSRSNTIWYIATRPRVEDPIPISSSDLRGNGEDRPAPTFELTDCHVPETCTDEALDHKAGSHSCRERINWLISFAKDKSQWEACAAVSTEYPGQCGPCNPEQSLLVKDEKSETKDNLDAEIESNKTAMKCPACSEVQCNSELNRCPMLERTFVCTKGASTGGCSGQPWLEDTSQCSECCEMTLCQEKRDKESIKVNDEASPLEKSVCPPCPKSICYGKLNQCPVYTAPYLCTAGGSKGGCSSRPWAVSESSPCSACCEIVHGC